MHLFKIFSSAILLSFVSSFISAQKLTDYVNPFIGTDGHGHTYPGATMPFGLMQLSPDTRLTGWDGCSGYHFTDSIIYGFSHTHLSGTGVSDYGDILLMPVSGSIGRLDDYGYQSLFRKETEHASPGYYEVFLDQPEVLVRLTSSIRSGMHQYIYKTGADKSVVLNLRHRDPVIEAGWQLVSNRRLVGKRRSDAWARDQHIYFVIEFDRDILIDADRKQILHGKAGISLDSLIDVFHFGTQGSDTLTVKVGISGVDIEGAIKNMETEVLNHSFEKVKEIAQQTWEEELGKIHVTSLQKERLITFYSALYHVMLAPNIWSDVDGRYRGMDMNIHHDMGIPQYTVFSLWDTYRTLHPLLNMIDQKRSRAFIHSFLRMYEQGGLLPVWELAANETYCMIGYHSIPVILDAWKKGIRDFDVQLALKAMLDSANRDHLGLKYYKSKGYIPADKEHESVSKTLEYAYDDWCIAMFAKELRNVEIYNAFIERAQYYKNLFDKNSGFMRPRINGAFKDPFAPSDVDVHFTEANSWQYSMYVPHDINNLFDMLGGNQKVESWLDRLFNTSDPLTGRNQVDITGLIGQYAHGNEPSHHMAFLYNYAGVPWKTQEITSQILNTLYTIKPDGLSGNEDCGQMSAWYVMTSMGMYPVVPGSNRFDITAPIFDEIRIKLENGSVIAISSPGASSNYPYIAAISKNGKDHNALFLNYEDIKDGANITFILQKQINERVTTKSWQLPEQRIARSGLVRNPIFSRVNKSFEKKMFLEIEADSEHQIFYRTIVNQIESPWTKYEGNVEIQKQTIVQAYAVNSSGVSSKIEEAIYIPYEPSISISILTPWHPSYGALGERTLIDGIRGPEDWKLGDWQGYQKQDVEIVIDLGKVKKSKAIGIGAIQDIRSWIWMPQSVAIYSSMDGQVFHQEGVLQTNTPPKSYDIQIEDFVFSKKMKARYLKIVARQFGEIPYWHLGAGGDSYIFLDEIWVK
jgi:predicted alpha-1,2-mannosidase